MLNMASCDRQGRVLLANDAVYRVVDQGQRHAVLNVLETIDKLDALGIVQTEICTDEASTVGIYRGAGALVLKHRKIAFISYPNEWCASMLKDAALFHLTLSEHLFKYALFLKDAHPWNILFENGQPILVDFTSVVSRDSLFDEDYLEGNKVYRGDDAETHLARLLKEIFERMYLPYFVNPLGVYAFGVRCHVRKRIENTTLNASTSVISLRDFLPALRLRKFSPTKLFGLFRLWLGLKISTNRLTNKKDVPNFYREVHQRLTDLRVEAGSSAYSGYYKAKGEDQDWNFSDEWNTKQKAVYSAINTPEIVTVLDVACNTGWFAVLAEKLGKHVVAFDIDEACIEALYGQVKNDRLNILPLVLDLTQLTQDRYSIYDGGIVLINTTQRLRADSVIALGIFHHLTLGVGLSFEAVLGLLMPLCKKQLVIEFVDANDLMIKNEPLFFPAYFQNKDLLSGYELARLVALCEGFGFDVRCEQSIPATRTILVCKKRETA
jgi:SAM-dependent methyltransferase